jgi:hypothetical protein
MQELERFDIDKVIMFTESMKEFLKTMVETQKKMLVCWKTYEQ